MLGRRLLQTPNDQACRRKDKRAAGLRQRCYLADEVQQLLLTNANTNTNTNACRMLPALPHRVLQDENLFATKNTKKAKARSNGSAGLDAPSALSGFFSGGGTSQQGRRGRPQSTLRIVTKDQVRTLR